MIEYYKAEIIEDYKAVFEDLTLKVLFDVYNVENASGLSETQKKQAKKKIKNLFYSRIPMAKNQVKSWAGVFKNKKGSSYNDYSPDQKIGSRIGREVFSPVYYKYGLSEKSPNKQVSTHNGIIGIYESLALNYHLIPNDKMFCELNLCSASTPANARARLKEEGFEFEVVEFENVPFWKVVKMPQRQTHMEQFLSSLSDKQKKMFKALLDIQ